MPLTPLAPPASGPPSDPVAIARGLIAAAVADGAVMPDTAALDVAAAWDALDEPNRVPDVVHAEVGPDVGVHELLLRARIVLREAIPAVPGGRRALALAFAIRHLDAALARLDGWTEGRSDR